MNNTNGQDCTCNVHKGEKRNCGRCGHSGEVHNCFNAACTKCGCGWF